MFTSVEWNVSDGGIHVKSREDFARAQSSFAQNQYQTLTEHDFWVPMNSFNKHGMFELNVFKMFQANAMG